MFKVPTHAQNFLFRLPLFVQVMAVILMVDGGNAPVPPHFCLEMEPLLAAHFICGAETALSYAKRQK